MKLHDGTYFQTIEVNRNIDQRIEWSVGYAQRMQGLPVADLEEIST